MNGIASGVLVTVFAGSLSVSQAHGSADLLMGRSAVLSPSRAPVLLDIAQDLNAAVIIGLADFGQADPSRGAIEQPCAEPVFERLNVVAHHRCRHVELARGG